MCLRDRRHSAGKTIGLVLVGLGMRHEAIYALGDEAVIAAGQAMNLVVESRTHGKLYRRSGEAYGWWPTMTYGAHRSSCRASA